MTTSHYVGSTKDNGKQEVADQYRKTARKSSESCKHPRSEAPSDIPTVGEFVPCYEASVWFGLGAPNGTPHEIIDKLNAKRLTQLQVFV